MNCREQNLRLGLFQHESAGQIEKTFLKVEQAARTARDNGVRVLCLQELFASHYFASEEDERHFSIAEPIPGGKITSFLSTLAIEMDINIIGGSIFEQGDDGKRYNTTLIIDDQGGVLSKYRKVHVPYDPYYYEKSYFSPGNLGYPHATISGIKIASLICYDQWFPEPVRILALRGVQLVVYPTAIGWFEELCSREPFSAQRWEDAIRAHASMNGIFVAAVNRIGKEGDLTFWGGSFVADPFGQVLKRASTSDEELLIVDIDLERVFESQDGWMFLNNRRSDTYGDLCR